MTSTASEVQREIFAGGTEPARETAGTTRVDTLRDRHPDSGRFFDVREDARFGVHFATLRCDAPAVFTPELIEDLRRGQAAVRGRVARECEDGVVDRLCYQVFASAVPAVFSLGGDLRLFRRHILERDHRALREYAMSCIDVVHDNATGYGLPITTISLVQGDALGGGFEAALAAHVVVAERQCKMGLPEILFNLFPGMGAAQLLTRRLPPAKAEAFIASGRTYRAEELYEMGLVDVLADEGRGEEAVWSYIRTHHRQARGRRALREVFAQVAPLDRESLERTTDMWVDAAMGISERDLEVIDYLIRAQARRTA